MSKSLLRKKPVIILAIILISIVGISLANRLSDDNLSGNNVSSELPLDPWSDWFQKKMLEKEGLTPPPAKTGNDIRQEAEKKAQKVEEDAKKEVAAVRYQAQREAEAEKRRGEEKAEQIKKGYNQKASDILLAAQRKAILDKLNGVPEDQITLDLKKAQNQANAKILAGENKAKLEIEASNKEVQRIKDKAEAKIKQIEADAAAEAQRIRDEAEQKAAALDQAEADKIANHLSAQQDKEAAQQEFANVVIWDKYGNYQYSNVPDGDNDRPDIPWPDPYSSGYNLDPGDASECEKYASKNRQNQKACENDPWGGLCSEWRGMNWYGKSMGRCYTKDSRCLYYPDGETGRKKRYESLPLWDDVKKYMGDPSKNLWNAYSCYIHARGGGDPNLKTPWSGTEYTCHNPPPELGNIPAKHKSPGDGLCDFSAKRDCHGMYFQNKCEKMQIHHPQNKEGFVSCEWKCTETDLGQYAPHGDYYDGHALFLHYMKPFDTDYICCYAKDGDVPKGEVCVVDAECAEGRKCLEKDGTTACNKGSNDCSCGGTAGTTPPPDLEPKCEDYTYPGACEADDDCNWINNQGCVKDGTDIPEECSDYDNAQECVARANCEWDNNQCVVKPPSFCDMYTNQEDCLTATGCLWKHDQCIGL